MLKNNLEEIDNNDPKDWGGEGQKAEIRSQKPEVGGQGKKEGRMDEIRDEKKTVG